jgi:hypothetical protein
MTTLAAALVTHVSLSLSRPQLNVKLSDQRQSGFQPAKGARLLILKPKVEAGSFSRELNARRK